MTAACMAGSMAQAQDSEVPGAQAQPLKPVQETISDPRLDMVGKLPMQVGVRPAAAMKQEDKDLAASSNAAIRKRAEFHDLGFSKGDWQESQIECPAFPQHLFLRFTRNLGEGDVSMFAASIPRGQEGRVRAIPILRRGYSLISPAPTNKVTIAAFNEILAEEHIGGKADWAALTMCYAALSSMRWDEPKSDIVFKPLGSDTLELGEKGEVSVALALDAPAAGRWVVTFDRKGTLDRTEYTPFGNQAWRQLPATATELKGIPLPSGPVETGRPLPVGPRPVGKPLPPSTEPNGKAIPPATSVDTQGKPQ